MRTTKNTSWPLARRWLDLSGRCYQFVSAVGRLPDGFGTWWLALSGQAYSVFIYT